MSMTFTRLSARGPISLQPGGPFQLAGHRQWGGLLISPNGIYDWSSVGCALDEAGLFAFLDQEKAFHEDFLLLGTGPRLRLLTAGFADTIERRGLGLEAMDTAAACRTYNILLAENRHFLAALLPL